MMLFLSILAVLCIVGTFLPLLDHDHWVIRGQAYFKAEYLALNVVVLLLFMTFMPVSWWMLVLSFLLLVSILYCLYVVLPFTPLAKPMIPLLGDDISPENKLDIFIANIYQYNKDYHKTIQAIRTTDPDLVFLLETDAAWDNSMKELSETYPYVLKEIREDTYGMLLFSKYAFQEGKVNYLVEDDVPSIEVLIQVNGHAIRIFGVHPKPPLPMEDPSSTSKDLELLVAANRIKNLPEDERAILIGDLNDVAWSRLSKEMLQITHMADPRVGRGFFSTFPAWSPVRIPLDHVFVDRRFRLLAFRVVAPIGSDHLPVFISLMPFEA